MRISLNTWRVSLGLLTVLALAAIACGGAQESDTFKIGVGPVIAPESV